MRFEQALTQFKGSVLAVVHDSTFIVGFASERWLSEGQRIRCFDLRLAGL